jgi:hypothetical protein
MLNCKQVSKLVSQEMEKPLSLSERIGLNLHLMMCVGCRNFKKQMGFLRRACERFPEKMESDQEI